MFDVRAFAILLLPLVAACGDEEPKSPTGESSGGGGGGSGGVDPGVGGCAAGELEADDGSCSEPGMQAADCASGFAHDGVDACEPILPAAPCDPGWMALPGETACREIAPCGSGTWGDIATGAGTQHVDGAFQGASDGSAIAPWTTIGQAFAAAADGATIAVAAGSYTEVLDITGKAVTLWGRCPSLVEIVAPTTDDAAVIVREGAAGTTVRGVALRGGAVGLAVSGASDVVAEALWIHDAVIHGLEASPALGEASLTLRGSLVENCAGAGVLIGGIEAVLEEVVVRDTQPNLADQTRGRGAVFQHDPMGLVPSDVAVSRAVFERNHFEGVTVLASNATFDETVVTDTRQQVSDQNGGRGINIVDDFVFLTGMRSTVSIARSFVARNIDANVSVFGSQLDMSATTIREAAADAASGATGSGIVVQIDTVTDERADATIGKVVVDGAFLAGLFAGGADVAFEASSIRNVVGYGTIGGRGFHVLGIEGATATVTVAGALVENTTEAAVSVENDAVLDITSLLGRNTRARPSDDLFGDGIAGFAFAGAQPSIAIAWSQIETSARAALTSFGAQVSVGTTRFECNPLDLNAEMVGTFSGSLEDAGGNRCGCGDEVHPCKVLSSTLGPPDPLPALDVE